MIQPLQVNVGYQHDKWSVFWGTFDDDEQTEHSLNVEFQQLKQKRKS